MKIFNFYYLQNLGLPLIRFTRSLDGSTGTASFLFKIKKNFESFKKMKLPLYKVYLFDRQNKIFSNKIKIFFKEGKPTMLLFIFVLRNKIQWNLIYSYTKDLVLKYN